MANTFSVAIKDLQGNNLKYIIEISEVYQKITNTLLRTRSIAINKHGTHFITNISDKVSLIINKTHFIPLNIIRKTISKFLKDIDNFTKFLNRCNIRYGPSKSSAYRTSRIYLHKLHRIAPVFDYSKAIINLKSLQRFCHQTSRWPRITTQLALVIYITDKNNINEIEKLQNINIRIITNCSAYAFYNLRNILIDEGVLAKDE
ncbi:MAG: hypothetical protein GF317_24380 [Candidatus Lokiarchaeota archaeon]|nr:hypothetical protein [Candidatus Lokiarchaeota archaeon]MBD3202511.1 hypothetical protein [Candidatus Lokiarchaeota archaeon]